MQEPSSSPADQLGAPLHLPCGAVIKNRFCKSATSEILGDRRNAPTKKLVRLYRTWAQGGAGLLVTGNVMIDRRHLGEPGNVVIEDERNMNKLRSWAEAGCQNRSHIWMQLNHPGRQAPKALSDQPVSPSAVAFRTDMARFFNPPRALSAAEIRNLVARFAKTAMIAKKAGFTGVQIHAAHGYLVSQFLSPLTNQRTDEWGGSAENRMRFVLRIYDAIRDRVGPDFPISIKLNSSDFMRGGLTEEESAQVAVSLAEAGIDLIEISGGTYERPAMTGRTQQVPQSDSEAYFLSYAEKIRTRINTPVALTGGFRTAAGMAAAVDKNGIDMVGLARPIVIDPELPNRILDGEDYVSPIQPIHTGIRLIDRVALLELTWYEQQLGYLGRGRRPRPNQGAWFSLAKTLFENGLQVFQKRRG